MNYDVITCVMTNNATNSVCCMVMIVGYCQLVSWLEKKVQHHKQHYLLLATRQQSYYRFCIFSRHVLSSLHLLALLHCEPAEIDARYADAYYMPSQVHISCSLVTQVVSQTAQSQKAVWQIWHSLDQYLEQIIVHNTIISSNAWSLTQPDGMFLHFGDDLAVQDQYLYTIHGHAHK